MAVRLSVTSRSSVETSGRIELVLGIQAFFNLSYTMFFLGKLGTGIYNYDTRCYFNVRSKADMSQLNLPHETNNLTVENSKNKK